MRIRRERLPRGVQSRYYQRAGVIVIDPAKVPRHAEDDVIAQSVLYAAGRSDLAPYASQPAAGRHLHAVADPPAPPPDALDESARYAGGVG